MKATLRGVLNKAATAWEVDYWETWMLCPICRGEGDRAYVQTWNRRAL